MRAHRGDCGWFWAWTAVGFALVFAFVAIYSVGPFLLPFAALAVVGGVAAFPLLRTPSGTPLRG